MIDSDSYHRCTLLTPLDVLMSQEMIPVLEKPCRRSRGLGP